MDGGADFGILADVPGVCQDIMACPQEELWQS